MQPPQRARVSYVYRSVDQLPICVQQRNVNDNDDESRARASGLGAELQRGPGQSSLFGLRGPDFSAEAESFFPTSKGGAHFPLLIIFEVLNPFTADPIKALRFVILVWPTIFNFWQSWAPERQRGRMSKIKNGGLDQYGAEAFEQQLFGTAGAEVLNMVFDETTVTNETSVVLFPFINWLYIVHNTVCYVIRQTWHRQLLYETMIMNDYETGLAWHM